MESTPKSSQIRKRSWSLLYFLPKLTRIALGSPGTFQRPKRQGISLMAIPSRIAVPALLVRFLEIEVGLEVRAEEDIIFSVDSRCLGELARDDRVDSPDFVADLPAHLEEVVIARFRHGDSPFDFLDGL